MSVLVRVYFKSRAASAPPLSGEKTVEIRVVVCSLARANTVFIGVCTATRESLSRKTGEKRKTRRIFFGLPPPYFKPRIHTRTLYTDRLRTERSNRVSSDLHIIIIIIL